MNTLELLDKKELLKKRAEEIISGAEKEVRKTKCWRAGRI